MGEDGAQRSADIYFGALRLHFRTLADDAGDEAVKLNRNQLDLRTRDSGIVEDVLDKVIHALSRTGDLVQKSGCLSRKSAGVVFCEGPRESANGAHGGAEIVGDAVGEVFHLSHGFGQGG